MSWVDLFWIAFLCACAYAMECLILGVSCLALSVPRIGSTTLTKIKQLVMSELLNELIVSSLISVLMVHLNL